MAGFPVTNPGFRSHGSGIASIGSGLAIRAIRGVTPVVNVTDPKYACVSDSGATDNTAGFLRAFADANTARIPVFVPPAVTGGYYSCSSSLAGTVLSTSPGMIGIPGLSQIHFQNIDGDCIIAKGSFKVFNGIYLQNTKTTSYTNRSAVLRIQNCAYGDFANLFTFSEGDNSIGLMLEMMYDGSADAAYLLVHIGCWYNNFRNITCVYNTLGQNTGYGLSFEVNTNAIGVTNPTGQPTGSYSGSVQHNDVTVFDIEGMAADINLGYASNNTFRRGQLLGGLHQIAGTHSNGNVFDGIAHNQWASNPFNLDSTCVGNEVRSPTLFNITSEPWSLGNLGTSPLVSANNGQGQSLPAYSGRPIQTVRVSTGSVTGGAVGQSAITWPVQWPDTNYTVAATIDQEDANMGTQHLFVDATFAKTTTGVSVQYHNSDSGAHTGTVCLIAVHD